MRKTAANIDESLSCIVFGYIKMKRKGSGLNQPQTKSTERLVKRVNAF